MTSLRVRSPARVGLVVALALMALAMAVPAVFDWNVRVRWFPPLHAEWAPRVGPGSLAALAIGAAGVVFGESVARRLPWRGLLVVGWAAGLAWLLALAFVDGVDGIGVILNDDYEYLNTARRVTDITATLHEYVGRIRYRDPHNWPVHIAGHPPGALLFFVLLVHLGLGSGLAAGLVVTLVASTTPVAVLVTLRVLGAEAQARLVAPLVVLSPAAIWAAVSADGMFAAVAAWGLAALAYAATRRSLLWSVLAGLLLGYCVLMSYGLTVLGILAVAVLVIARSFFPLAPAVVAALAVVVAFFVGGFAYWEALPAVRDRYFSGVGGRRPVAYWLWGGPAALCFSAGPLVGAGLANAFARWREFLASNGTRVVVGLSGAAALSIVVAVLSLLSKAEVERIWLPFVPWLLVCCALLPERWRRRGLALQVSTALVVQHLLFTGW